MADAKATPKPRAKPSGVKSESAREAGQLRDLTEQITVLRRACVALSQGNQAAAQRELGSAL